MSYDYCLRLMGLFLRAFRHTPNWHVSKMRIYDLPPSETLR